NLSESRNLSAWQSPDRIASTRSEGTSQSAHADDDDVLQSWGCGRRQPHDIYAVLAIFRDPADPCAHPVARARINRRVTLDAGNPGNFQPFTDGLDSHGIDSDGGGVSRDVDSRGGGRTSAGRQRRLRDQRLECRREHDVVVLKQGWSVANRDAYGAGKNSQRILNKRSNSWTIVTRDAALKLTKELRQ